MELIETLVVVTGITFIGVIAMVLTVAFGILMALPLMNLITYYVQNELDKPPEIIRHMRIFIASTVISFTVALVLCAAFIYGCEIVITYDLT